MSTVEGRWGQAVNSLETGWSRLKTVWGRLIKVWSRLGVRLHRMGTMRGLAGDRPWVVCNRHSQARGSLGTDFCTQWVTEGLWLGESGSGWQGFSAICPNDFINPSHIFGDSGEDSREFFFCTSIRCNTMDHPSTD